MTLLPATLLHYPPDYPAGAAPPVILLTRQCPFCPLTIPILSCIVTPMTTKTMLPVLAASNDRKVASCVTKNGKQAAFSNTMGLANGIDYSCVGATEYCELICYAGKLENLFKGVGAAMLHNYNALKDANNSGSIPVMLMLPSGCTRLICLICRFTLVATPIISR